MNIILYNILYYGYLVLWVYYSLIFLEWILSFTPLSSTRFYGFIRKITDPYNDIFRGKIVIGWFDLSGTIGLLLFYFALRFMESVLG